MIRVKIVFTETGTGEEGSFITNLPELTGEAVIKAVTDYTNDPNTNDPHKIDFHLKLRSWVQVKRLAAVIATCHDNYFGDMIWTMQIYQDFIEG